MTNEEILSIVNNHQHWLNKDCAGWEGMRANFAGAGLIGASLRGSDLRGANLNRACLIEADLRGADLREADLRGADLFGASLIEADLSRSDLRGADLRGANLKSADLSRAGLFEADLNGANLHNTLLKTANAPLANYRKGIILRDSIIGYKKCENDTIVTLEIPEGAVVFSINGCKCRTNKAKVIAIDGANRAFSTFNHMSYYVGDEFTIYDFNLEYNEECAEGIHFFMTRKEAEQY